MIDLKAIKARCEAATEGPWENFQSCLNAISVYFGNPPREICSYVTDAVSDKFPVRVRRNMRFIAHARQDLPDCIEEIERLRERFQWIADQPCEKLAANGETTCNGTGDCITEWCYPCYARKALETK